MRHLRAVAVFAALGGLLLTAGPAAARNLADAFTLTPLIGGHLFEGNQVYKDDWTYGLGIGYNYDETWGTELLLHYTDAVQSSLPGKPDADIFTGMLNGIHHFLPEGPLVPYVTLGIGMQRRENDGGSNENDFLFNYGVGAKYFITQAVALRADLRHVLAFDQGLDELSKGHDNLLYSAGLSFQFGAPAPAVAETRPAPTPAPAPAPVAAAGPQDSDGDGVTDDRDQCPNTVKGVMVDERGCPISLSIHVEFDFDQAEIKPEFEGELKRAADFIAKYDAPKILIAGHTDSTGEAAYNKSLSDRRAAAVRQFLLQNYDLDPNRLVSRGYGEDQPVASNDDPEGRARNRRTEIVCCVFIPEE